MRKIIYLLFFILFYLQSFAQQFPAWDEKLLSTPIADWLLKKPSQKAGVYQDLAHQQIIFYNGLVKRSFVVSPDFTCIDFTNLSKSPTVDQSSSARGKACD